MITSVVCSDPFSITLNQPINIGSCRMDQRECCTVRIIADDGREGLGELCPAPELRGDNFSDAYAQLTDVCERLVGQGCPLFGEGCPQMIQMIDQLRSLSNTLFPKLYPSVRNALEMALFSMSLPSDIACEVPLNGLIMASDRNFEAGLKGLLGDGYRSVKMKVGSSSVEHDIERVKKALDIISGRATLRLDANCAWPFEDAVEFAQAVNCDVIEYIEEPLEVNMGHSLFYHDTGMNVACDESLQTAHRNQEMQNIRETLPDLENEMDGVSAFVIKPLFVGGIVAACDLARFALDHGLKVVLSSAFEGEVAICNYARLAEHLGMSGVPQGLDTWKWLEDEPKLFTVENGVLKI